MATDAANSGGGKGDERAAESVAAAVRARLGAAVVLSTCNRLEVYCWTERPRARERLARLLASWSGLPYARLSPYLYARTGEDAAHHLIRVAAGLDSLAVGETQVLGQVRAAWIAARRESPLGPELDSLFRRTVEAARRIRRGGAFDRHPSIAAIAVEAAAHSLGSLERRHIAILGAGVTGQASLRAALAAGASLVTLLNRSRRRLADLSGTLRGELPEGRVAFANLEALPEALATADALICATAASVPVVPAQLVAAALTRRGKRPLVIVDVAVPRDVEPATRAMAGVRLFDLDDLAAHCALDDDARRAALERAGAIASQEAAAFAAALRLRTTVPGIAALRTRAAQVRATELRRVRGRLDGLSPRQLAIVEQLTHAIVQKLLHPPTVALRRAAGGSASARRARAAIVATLTDPTSLRNP
jgi:glutamyl-tRNA reductase